MPARRVQLLPATPLSTCAERKAGGRPVLGLALPPFPAQGHSAGRE